MKLLSTLNNKCRIVRAITAFQNTMLYPLFYGAAAVAASSFGVYAYVPAFYVMAAMTLYAALFNNNFRVLLVSVFLSYFAVGSDILLTADDSKGDFTQYFCPEGFMQMIICAGIMAAALLIRFIADGLFIKIFKTRSCLSLGLLAVGAAYILGGVMFTDWTIADLLTGAALAGALLFAFYMFRSGLTSDKSNNGDDNLTYVCKIGLIAALTICAEAGILVLKLYLADQLLIANTPYIDHTYIVLGWGINNLVAAMLTMLIPLAIYVANSRKYSAVTYLFIVLMLFVLFVLGSRGAFFVGIAVFVIGELICCFSGKNKQLNRYYNGIFILLGIIVFIALALLIGPNKFFDGIANLLHLDAGDNGRFTRWEMGMADYTSYPIFGVGFCKGSADAVNMFSNMYHNLIIQLLGSMGTVGIVAFALHFLSIIYLTVRKFSAKRCFIVLSAMSVLMMSAVDNYFFYPNVLPYYAIMLAVADIELKNKLSASAA